jgi:hypothetical protein
MVRLAQDQRHVCVKFEGTSIKNVVIFFSCKRFIKKTYK